MLNKKHKIALWVTQSIIRRRFWGVGCQEESTRFNGSNKEQSTDGDYIMLMKNKHVFYLVLSTPSLGPPSIPLFCTRPALCTSWHLPWLGQEGLSRPRREWTSNLERAGEQVHGDLLEGWNFFSLPTPAGVSS